MTMSYLDKLKARAEDLVEKSKPLAEDMKTKSAPLAGKFQEKAKKIVQSAKDSANGFSDEFQGKRTAGAAEPTGPQPPTPEPGAPAQADDPRPGDAAN
jgi:hypothetical protein